MYGELPHTIDPSAWREHMLVPRPSLEACDTVSTTPVITPKSVSGRPDDSPPHKL